MYKFQWHHYNITTNYGAEQMRNLFRSTNPYVAGFDTETTGLHPVLDKPFLFQFGWIDINTMQGYTFTVDLQQRPMLARQVIKVWHALVKGLLKYIGHHVIFDLHMMTNIELPYPHNNLTDTMAYIRLGNDAIQEDKGGAPLGLKKFATRYIDSSANDNEQALEEEKSKITSEYNNALKKALGWTKKQIDTFFKDKLNEVEDLPPHLQEAYNRWYQSLPDYLQEKVTGAVEKDMIRYDYLNRENVTMYGHQDIVLTLESWWLLQETVHVRSNEDALAIEEANIRPLYEMERVGFKADKAYLLNAKQKVRSYIRTRRQDLVQLAGQPVSIGQHALVQTILQQMGVTVESTGNEVLSRIHSELKRGGDYETAVEFIETLQELRTLEKWYSTYICRFLYTLLYTDLLYTSINAYGAVSGRVTCDFQQFPKKALKTIAGEELFHPRKLIIVKEDTKGIVFLDYSQVELRLQAMYTILVGTPDLNLCRAYMPYQCVTVTSSGKVIPFSYDDQWCIQRSYDLDWYYMEEPTKRWEPLDVHGATTKAAFGITEDDPEYHNLRYVGKRVNFAKNYGAQRGKIAEMFPEFSEDRITQIDAAYYKAFPGVKAYHNYCYAIAIQQPYAQNLYGVKYWGVSGHNLINTLVQGSGAYLIKTKITAINQYLKEQGYQSVVQMQIHDEIWVEWREPDPPELLFTIKEILQACPDFLVPIVSDMEITYTNWAEKTEVKDIEQLKV